MHKFPTFSSSNTPLAGSWSIILTCTSFESNLGPSWLKPHVCYLYNQLCELFYILFLNLDSCALGYVSSFVTSLSLLSWVISLINLDHQRSQPTPSRCATYLTLLHVFALFKWDQILWCLVINGVLGFCSLEIVGEEAWIRSRLGRIPSSIPVLENLQDSHNMY